MKRYYLCRRLGDGTYENPYRSELRTWARDNYPGELHFELQVVGHVCPWVIMAWDLTDSTHATAMATLTNIFSFPEERLDITFIELGLAVRNGIKNRLVAIGLDDTWIIDSTTLKEIIEYIAHSLQIAEWLDIQISGRAFDKQRTFGSLTSDQKDILRTRLEYAGINASWLTDSNTIGDVSTAFQQINFKGRKYLFDCGA